MNSIKQFNSGLATSQRWLLGFLMFTLTAAMLAEVITRYFFGTSLFGLEQHVGYTAVWIYFVGSAYGAYERSHIKAEFIRILFKSHRKFYISKVASGIVASAMCIVFAQWSLELVCDSIRIGEKSPDGYGVPMVIYQSALLIGAILMAAYFLWEAIDFARRAKHITNNREAIDWKQ